MKDVFRETKGEMDGFTYRHDCGWESRIDRVYTEEDFVGKITGFDIETILGQTAGHKAVTVTIEEGLKLGKGYWKFNVSLLRDQSSEFRWTDRRTDNGRTICFFRQEVSDLRRFLSNFRLLTFFYVS